MPLKNTWDSINNSIKKNELTFIGTPYGNRPYYLWRILQNELPLNIYGPFWKDSDSINGKLKHLIFSLFSFFGFLLLLEFKRVVIETFRLMGLSRIEVTFGFLFGGGILGIIVASMGVLLAWSGRLLIQAQGWIPFEHFFTEWPPMLFVAVFVLTPICVAVFSALVVRFSLSSLINMSEMG